MNNDVLSQGVNTFMDQILNTISPHHLEALSIDVSLTQAQQSISLVPTTFPALRELIFHAPQITGDMLSQSALCPSLQRLYIKHYSILPTNFAQELARLFPNFTHLRVDSGMIGDESRVLPHLLHAYCEVNNPKTAIPSVPTIYTRTAEDGTQTEKIVLNDTVAQRLGLLSKRDEQDPTAFVPLSLRRIIVGFLYHVFPSPIRGWTHVAWATVHAHREIGKLYSSISREQGLYGVGRDEDHTAGCEDQKRSMLILNPRPFKTGEQWKEEEAGHFEVMFKQSKREWLERTSGSGIGCWI